MKCYDSFPETTKWILCQLIWGRFFDKFLYILSLSLLCIACDIFCLINYRKQFLFVLFSTKSFKNIRLNRIAWVINKTICDTCVIIIKNNNKDVMWMPVFGSGEGYVPFKRNITPTPHTRRWNKCVWDHHTHFFFSFSTTLFEQSQFPRLTFAKST